jgi:hypothetical protein
VRRAGDCGHYIGQPKQQGPRDEGAPATEVVADRSGRQHQRCERDGVGVGDPGEIGRAGISVQSDVGQCHIDAGDRRLQVGTERRSEVWPFDFQQGNVVHFDHRVARGPGCSPRGRRARCVSRFACRRGSSSRAPLVSEDIFIYGDTISQAFLKKSS